MKHHDIDISKRNLIGSLAKLSLLGGGIAALALAPDFRQQVLDAASRWNDVAQGHLYSASNLAPTFSTNQISRSFRYNGFYPEAYAPEIDPSTWQLKLGGRITHKKPLTLNELRNMQQEAQITRLICIEGWSAIGQWSGVPLSYLLPKIGADLDNTYLRLDCADGYHTSIDMASAMHSQTILALDFLGQPLPRSYGAPARLRIPVKLGFKNAKFVTGISVHRNSQGGYWEDQGYNDFSGL
ncbi:molybdopterin-dependent oxidoreductase [Agarilytica rhodophyticola]|uniref:molybdopterin-dependent oxidoreductase n=1 Tax=Agarilytica rhodophyticola TaxID=1737490 RepID=UPI000B343C06|nr:molybdopterin-dependent oxidoreductase [Agarilytica rhodophyticola]